MNKLLLVGVVVVVSGCGTIDGAPCETEKASQCDGADVSFCERTNLGGLKWNTYACPSGCDAIAGKCNWAGVKAQDECPGAEASVARTQCTGAGEVSTCARVGGKIVWQPRPCAKCRAGATLDEALVKNGDGTYNCE